MIDASARPVGHYTGILVPVLRLLMACVLVVVIPALLGMNHLSVAWLAIPCAVLSYTSCRLQNYRRPRVIFLCTASILGTLLVLYALALAAVTLF